MISVGSAVPWAVFSCIVQKSRVLLVCDLIFTDVILIGDMSVTIKVGLIPSIPNVHHFNGDCFFLSWWRRKFPDISSDDFSIMFDWINAPVVNFTWHKWAIRCEDVICLLRLKFKAVWIIAYINTMFNGIDSSKPHQITGWSRPRRQVVGDGRSCLFRAVARDPIVQITEFIGSNIRSISKKTISDSCLFNTCIN